MWAKLWILNQVEHVCIQMSLRFKMLNLFNLSKFKVKAGFASTNEY
jgi:hypothetical protein